MGIRPLLWVPVEGTSFDRARGTVAGLLAAALMLGSCGGGGDAPTDAAGTSAADKTAATAGAPRALAKAIAAPSQGRWSPVVNLTLVPAAASLLPTGKVLLWSGEQRFSFNQGGGQTYTTLFDPATSSAVETLVTNTGHDMFCPGTSNLPDGRILVGGGSAPGRTSIYNPFTNSWSTAAALNVPRGYHANCVLQDGSVFTLGGSWSGPVGGKHGEIWTDGGGWRVLSGVPVTPMLSADPFPNNAYYSNDSHFWLLPAGNGKVFHAGPGFTMHWIDTRGNGSVTAVGPRGDDEFSINGNVTMYDVGRILKNGGAAGYEDLFANANSYVIDINAGVSVRKLAPMVYPRTYQNSVVLPNGQVLVVGGMTFAKNFNDTTAVLPSELWDPVSETFTVVPAIAVPRTYHSVALLLPDARVLSAGGGLCGNDCAANHPDLQIYTPHYLINDDGTDAVRPVIASAPAQATHGTLVDVTTDSPIGAFSLVRVGTTTHTVNNDQRRIPLAFTSTAANAYRLTLPSNPGVVLPGYYMLFAMTPEGVPSVAHMIRITGSGAPTIVNPDDQTTAVGAAVSLAIGATSQTSFAASGLPPGLSINPSSGVIGGAPTAAGRYAVTLVAANAQAQTSTTIVWTVGSPGGGGNQPPNLAQPGDQVSTIGQPVSLSLVASDPNGDVLGYAATGLPPGLSIDPSTGLIGGTPTTAGQHAVTVQVTDGRGGVATATFAWQVASAGFTIDPVAAPAIPAAGSANFSVASNGGAGTTYSWLFGDGTPATAFSSATTASHTYAAAGLYVVTVTARTADGTTTTRTFMQVVTTAPASSLRPTQSSNIVTHTAAGGSPRVWLVNQDNDSVTVFDGINGAKLGEAAVGAAPRSVARAPDGRVWVTNKDAASISIIAADTLTVVQTVTLPRGSMPFGIAFAPDGAAAYVALEGTGVLAKLHPSTGATLGTAVVGANARHLAITPASDRVLVSRFVSPPLPGESTATVSTEVGGVPRGGEVVVVTSALAIERTVVLRHSDRPDSSLQGSGVPNYLAGAAIAPDGSIAWVPSKQDNVKRGTLRNATGLDFQNTVRAVSSRIELTGWTEDPALRIDHDNASLASAAVFHPHGGYLFVALQTSRHVAVIDPLSRTELFRVDTGRAPDGLAISADGLRLYVNNFMDRSLGIHDLSRLTQYGESSATLVASPVAITTERLASNVLQGKRLFYDARDTRLARDGYMSCASCHNDGGHDGRVWDMTGFGEGLRNTVALRGRGTGHGRAHWTGNFDEVQDFELQIRNLAGGTGLMSDAALAVGTRSQPLGDVKAGLSSDLDALAAYVNSLTTFAPSPWRPSATTLSPAAIAGKDAFVRLTCATCHQGQAYSNSSGNALPNVGTIKPTSGMRLGAPLTGFDVPTLRDVWSTAPYLHDGSAATLDAAISAHTTLGVSAADATSIAAYLREIGSDEGAAPIGGARSTIWPETAAPGNLSPDVDGVPITLGTRFRSDVDGQVTAIRFYKVAQNTGAHLGGLWTAGGQLLANVAFTAETPSGWQEVALPNPVPITAGSIYIVGYHTAVGTYTGEDNYFTANGVDNPPLHALRDGESGANGVYAYGAGLAFPTQTYRSESYWVDVVLQSGAATDTTPPTVTTTAPANGATGVATGSAVTATFSEAIDPATLTANTFALRTTVGGTAVAASVNWNAATRVATLTPASPLTAGTGYTATVVGGAIDPRVKDAAGNALASTVTWSFTTVAAPPVDTTPPTVTASSPPDGATGVATGSAVTATFSEAIDPASLTATTFALRTTVGGNTVAAGVSWNAATRVATLTPAAALAAGTSYTATLVGGTSDPRIKDLAGNALISSTTWSFTTAAASTTTSTIWPATAAPSQISDNDPSALTVGTRFRADVDGFVTAIRFYKGPQNTGTHVGGVWTAGGTLLGSVTFSGETASGWQQATLSTPVAITANTVYVVGYHAPNGNYPGEDNYFATNGVDNPPLHALRDGESGPNGVYIYGPSLAFPTQTYLSENYWVDVVFQSGGGSNPVPPTVTATTPASGATGVPSASVVTATFSKAIDPATLTTSTFTLRVTSSGAPVTAGVGWNAATRVATLTPGAALAAGTSYTAAVVGGASGVKDTEGNALGATLQWAFTTAAAGDTTPPTVTATVPAANATGVGRSANITATFSEAMTAATINTSTIELRDAGGNLVPAIVTYSTSNRRATLNPTPTLAVGATYTVTVRGGTTDPRVKDVAGNALAADRVWSFRTR